jgi:muskelin
MLTSYKSILSSSSIRLEHPLITQLYSTLVLQGDWSATESLLAKLSEAGLFDTYLNACQPRAVWKRLHGVDADGDVPSKRGGHAMCIDQGNRMIYLFGGWDGQKSLDDFWQYDIQEERWRVLSHSTSSEKNGPEPRSCHKMVFDAKTGCIYLLGRLSDKDELRDPGKWEGGREGEGGGGGEGEGTDVRESGEATEESNTVTPFCSEFYRYHTRGLDMGKWDLLSFDTAVSIPFNV